MDLSRKSTLWKIPATLAISMTMVAITIRILKRIKSPFSGMGIFVLRKNEHGVF